MQSAAISHQHYRLFALCFLGVAFGALNSMLAPAYLPEVAREFVGSADDAVTGKLGAWVNFLFLAGSTVGGIFLGFASDRIGRRTVFLWAILCYGLGSAVGALAPGWEILALTRLLGGIGVGAALVLSAVIISEHWPAHSKAIALGVLSVAYPVGIITSGFITSSVSDWRVALGIGGLAILLVLPLRRWMQESPRLPGQMTISHGESLADYQPVLIRGILVYGTMLIGLWATFSWLPTWVQSMIGVDNPEGQSQRGLSMALLGVGGIAGGVLSGYFVNRFGGKAVQAVCFVLCFLLSFWLFQLNRTYNPGITVGIALLGLCFGVSQGVLNDYIPEQFPAALRSAATGLCFHTGRVFTAAAVFFVGAFVVWFGGYSNAIFAFSGVYIIGLLALLKK